MKSQNQNTKRLDKVPIGLALMLTVSMQLASCSGGDGNANSADAGATDTDADSDSDTDTGSDTDTDADTDTDTNDDTDPDAGEDVCETLFGAPNENTGLTSEQCVPRCDCEGLSFAPPEYSEEEIAAIEAMENLSPPGDLEANPYDSPDEHPAQPDKFCGAVFDEGGPGTYSLGTFDTEQAAADAGAVITHFGACGLCSTLQDLAVYMRIPDLTGPVRDCGIIGAFDGEEANMSCLEDLGFTHPCARIWYYNTVNTRTECIDVCASMLDDPYHQADGSLNDCIQCDEDVSGDIFKAVAGRTRRNSGLPTALCRPCDTVAPVVHAYPI